MTDIVERLRERMGCYDRRGWTAIHREAADEIERLRGLLYNKEYIQLKADYNKGHLSHAGWLQAREKKA